jgi:photosystem II stability/assembly factor-like uncharacterized protein
MNVKPIGFAVWLLLLVGAASPSGEERTGSPSDSNKTVGSEPEAIRQRTRLYLERHGDGGRIDPEQRLKAVASDYALRRAEAARRRVGPQGVGGSNWISLGPTNGAGRMTAIAPHPTIAGTLYVGAAGGGVWKTTDGGGTWTPLTDDLSALSVGALAVAPSSPNIIYLGSGEGGYNGDFIPGIGLVKSSDGGATWNLPDSVVASAFYRITFHPTNPLELVAGTNQGGLRSTDGGETWTNVISRATHGDVVDIVRHSSDPSTLYAATWCINDCSAGVGKILKSTDGGVTWVEKSAGLPKTTGLPAAPQSSWFQVQERIALAISPSNPLVLYAATVEYNGGSRTSGSSYPSRIYRTTVGGESWAPTGLSRNYLVAQAWYDNTIIVSPNDPNTIFAGGVFYVRSTDGGATFTSPFESTNVHVDAHDLRYQGTTLYIANDGGLWSSPDDGQTASGRNTGLVTQQFYRVGIDPVHRNRILAGAQDTGTSQRPDTGGTEWRVIDGDDGFDCPVNFPAPNFAYFTLPGARIFRIEDAAAATPVFSYVGPLPFNHAEMSPFLTTVAMDPIGPSTIYTGTYRVWRSDNAGDTWLPLPTATADGSVWEASTVVDAIAVSRSQPSVLMASKSSPPLVPSNDPLPVQVFRSTDGGATWVAASGGLPPAKVNNLEIDATDASVAYAAVATT